MRKCREDGGGSDDGGWMEGEGGPKQDGRRMERGSIKGGLREG